jgi:hypothetical protein
MPGFPWGSGRYGYLQVVDWFQGMELGSMSRETNPMRSVYNPRTHQYEEIPLTQFQQLLKQGKIEEAASQSPYDGHAQKTYRLI